MDKQWLRKWAKSERAKLDIQALSLKLAEKLRNCNEYQNAKNIMIFYPLDDEVDLRSLLEDKTKNFYLPKVNGEELLCCPYNNGDELCLSCFKTKEPTTQPVEKDLIDLVIAPALAVDKENYRLGYGGGFYDRFLADISCVKVTCISEKLLVDSIFPEKTDIKMDIVLTA